MNVTELIQLLKQYEHGFSGRSRNISFVNDGRFTFEPEITVNSTGDGIAGAEITLQLEGEGKGEAVDESTTDVNVYCEACMETDYKPLFCPDCDREREHITKEFYYCAVCESAPREKEHMCNECYEKHNAWLRGEQIHVDSPTAPYYKHVKTGRIYSILNDYIINTTNAHEGGPMVLYTDGKQEFVRTAAEFFDGRFKRL